MCHNVLALISFCLKEVNDMNAADYIIIGVIIIDVTVAAIWIVRRKKQQKSGCAGCQYRDGCRDEFRDECNKKDS